MGIRYRTIYICDNCGIEVENKDEILLFKGNVTNGDETITFIKQDSMLCKNCCENSLKINHKVIEVQKIEIQETEKIPEEEFTVSEENTFTNGKYLILYRIKNEEDENQLAQIYGYKDAEDLRKVCERSFIDVFISTDRYLNELPNGIKQFEREIINKVIFGIPNITVRQIYLLNQDFGLIEKKDFDIETSIVEPNREKEPKENTKEELKEKEEEPKKEIKINKYLEDIRKIIETEDDLEECYEEIENVI